MLHQSLLKTLIAAGLVILASRPCAADDMLIVPGKRIGAVTVGMSRAQAGKVLGAPSSSNDLSPHRVNVTWPLPGKGDIHVQFVDGKAARVGTTAKEYATADGLAGGASVAKMRSLHPTASETDYEIRRKGGVAAQCYDDVAAGIGFEFDKGPAQQEFVLRAIYVHAPGKAMACNRKDDPRALEHVDATKSGP